MLGVALVKTNSQNKQQEGLENVLYGIEMHVQSHTHEASSGEQVTRDTYARGQRESPSTANWSAHVLIATHSYGARCNSDARAMLRGGAKP